MLRKKGLASLTWCIFSLAISCWGREPANLYSHLQELFGEIENRQMVTATITRAEMDALVKEADPNRLLRFLRPYATSEDVAVRSHALGLEVRVAELHPSSEVRQKVVQSLVSGLIGKRETDRALRRKYRGLLCEFSQQDFTKVASAAILNDLQANKPTDDVILVSGVAQLKEALPVLEKLLFDEVAYRSDPKMRHFSKWYHRIGWDARLARARMGIKQDIERCIALIEEEIDGNKQWWLLDHLGYIRQPEAIESLKGYFLSNLRLPPTNPGMEGEAYSNYLMPILEDSLLNWPVRSTPIQRSARVYSEEQIQLCKEWMAEQTEWRIRR